MAATSHTKGNPITFTDKGWVYADGTPISEQERPCVKCGILPTHEGYDACLGYIKGVKSACCGHGVDILIME